MYIIFSINTLIDVLFLILKDTTLQSNFHLSNLIENFKKILKIEKELKKK